MVFCSLLLKSDAGFFEVGGGGIDDADHEEIEVGEADAGAESLAPVLAVDDDHPGAWQLLGTILEISQRDMDSLAGMRCAEFRIGPDVEEESILIALEEGLDLSGLEIGDFGLVEE